MCEEGGGGRAGCAYVFSNGFAHPPALHVARSGCATARRRVMLLAETMARVGLPRAACGC